MRTLILVRHSLPEIDPGKPSHQWELAAEGWARCMPLALRLADHRPQVVITSRELKAAQTGEQVARQLGIPCLAADGLHEHRRQAGEWISREAFLAKVAGLFAQPERLVFGLETAQEALERFSAALQAVMAGRKRWWQWSLTARSWPCFMGPSRARTLLLFGNGWESRDFIRSRGRVW